jgi:hypothetical protein
MTRIVRVETCDRCPYAAGSRGCRHPDALVEVAGVPTTRVFDDYFVIPAWCPLEQAGPDWRPPAATSARGDLDEGR